MGNLIEVIQDPAPGTRILMFRGDIKSFTLSLFRPQKGNAWLRTNIGHAKTSRKEIIRKVLNHEPPLGSDWFDIPMNRVDDQNFLITLPLCEVGHFEAKCFFLGEDETTPVWPKGPNTVINVEPTDTCCSNIIYNAFVRQFGPNKKSNSLNPATEDSIRTLDQKGYAVIPPSGTFLDLIEELDFIIKELGCRIIQLLPIHPTPTIYARMGRFGSPYAALNFTAVDPALAKFDSHATPLEQFIELVDAVHERRAKIFLDIAINHTGWAADLHETHPQWLARDPDGQIKVPGAWGTIWADLTTLDYSNKGLWTYMADVFLMWCHRGVDGFRCDAGYMIPVPAWQYIVAVVREQYPDTIFLLEGLGGKISVTRDILNKANFNWAYSELFQNYNRNQIENYLPEANEISTSDGIMVHFAETHDNIRLASRSKVFARMRTALCALCSHHGGFGFANGVEWYATEKINVHEAHSLNWGEKSNQVEHIRRLNTLLKTHPAFYDQTELKMLQQDGGNYIALLRHHLHSGKKLLIVANLDVEQKTLGVWDPQQAGMEASIFWDLISEEEVAVAESHGHHTFLLEPGQVLCLTADQTDVDLICRKDSKTEFFPELIKSRQIRAKALDVLKFYKGTRHIETFKVDKAAGQLAEDPIEYCRSLNKFSQESRVITWQWPQDIKREVMVPPDHFLLVRADTPFCSRIIDKHRCLYYEESLPCLDGSFFAFFSPLSPPDTNRPLILKLSVYAPGKTQHIDGPLLFLSHAKNATVKRIYYRPDFLGGSLLMLGTNGSGALSRAHVSWGKLASRYDALLAGNIDPKLPEDRWIMFTRCRAWLVFQDYSQGICNDCLFSFCYGYNSTGFWRFKVPTGQREHVLLTIGVEMVHGENSLRMVFSRDKTKGRKGKLADYEQVRLILRPDIENRNFHETTKAYRGPEHLWPKAVKPGHKGFTFAPDHEHSLSLQISEGSFIWEPEWQYMVHHPIEAERGLDPDSDLFSPGYFSLNLKGGQSAELTARIISNNAQSCQKSEPPSQKLEADVFENNESWKLNKAMEKTLNHYVVNRGSLNTVIAGYPWFLDWGRDAMIFVRGLIAAREIEKARSILKQFAQFEKNGTIPNMINGKDAGNRNTSDAPLWFFVACADLIHTEGNEDFLSDRCGDRTVLQILFSIAHAYIAGTHNGIHMDPESGLIFSPGHFTWMDTNHPAGTPREGYPIEIQALWYAALSFLSLIESAGNGESWKKIAEKVRLSIHELFTQKEGWLSDCLHTGSEKPASQAEADDALRPNQLFTITLGAVSKRTTCQKILRACEELLVPAAVRSLADRPVRRPLSIVYKGNDLIDPYHPYQGKYHGDENTKRKPAYHNGTAWTWLFPNFCEAWVKVYGKSGRNTALSLLASSVQYINQGCVGHVPEILDGDFPHKQRGCDAQAWGASEIVRVWELLSTMT